MLSRIIYKKRSHHNVNQFTVVDSNIRGSVGEKRTLKITHWNIDYVLKECFPTSCTATNPRLKPHISTHNAGSV